MVTVGLRVTVRHRVRRSLAYFVYFSYSHNYAMREINKPKNRTVHRISKCSRGS